MTVYTFDGAMAENAVLQSIKPLLDDQTPYYWTSPGTAEVEFVIQWDDKIIPVEVKAEENISGNSLSEYNKKYAPPYRMRFSMLNLQYNSGLLSSLAPLAGWIDKWMSMIPCCGVGSVRSDQLSPHNPQKSQIKSQSGSWLELNGVLARANLLGGIFDFVVIY